MKRINALLLCAIMLLVACSSQSAKTPPAAPKSTNSISDPDLPPEMKAANDVAIRFATAMYRRDLPQMKGLVVPNLARDLEVEPSLNVRDSSGALPETVGDVRPTRGALDSSTPTASVTLELTVRSVTGEEAHKIRLFLSKSGDTYMVERIERLP